MTISSYETLVAASAADLDTQVAAIAAIVPDALV